MPNILLVPVSTNKNIWHLYIYKWNWMLLTRRVRFGDLAVWVEFDTILENSLAADIGRFWCAIQYAVTPITSFCPWATYWTIPPFVEPLLFVNLAWRALSWCRRTSVRPPNDIEKSIAHRLHCAMPLSGNFAIQVKSLFQSSLNLHFLFGAISSTGDLPSHIPRIWKTARANYPKNAGEYPIGIHHPKPVTNVRPQTVLIFPTTGNNLSHIWVENYQNSFHDLWKEAIFLDPSCILNVPNADLPSLTEFPWVSRNGAWSPGLTEMLQNLTEFREFD